MAADAEQDQARIDLLTDAISLVLRTIPGPTERHMEVLRRAYRDAYPTTPAPMNPSLPADVASAYHNVMSRSIGTEEKLRSLEGGELSSRAFASALHVSESTVRRYRAQRKVFALPDGSRGHRYPAWQIAHGALLPGLPEVLAILHEKISDPFDFHAFFLSPRDVLEGARPIDLLRAGFVESVLRAAHLAGDMGA